MCGIAGYVDTQGGPPPVDVLERMSRVLAHRGPDGERTLVAAFGPGEPTVVLAHRRLAIIDLTATADQPLANEDGKFIVDFNGEIYNFRALRRDLEARRHRFSSYTDTGVLFIRTRSMGIASLNSSKACSPSRSGMGGGGDCS